jgi:tight adherence protein B
MGRLSADRRRALVGARPRAGLPTIERWLAPRLAAADVDVPVDRLVVGGLAGVVVSGVVGGPVLAGVGLVAGLVSAVVALRLLSGRREARLERELPRLLEAVARSLRSGASVPGALRDAAATDGLAAADLAVVLVEVDRGRPLVEALDRWAGRRASAAVRLVVGVLSVALGSGGAPARAVDGVAATLRERAEVDREVRALATQARASAVVITVAPLAFAALGLLGDEQTADFLLRTPTGLACLAAGIALDAAGAWWMARIARQP